MQGTITLKEPLNGHCSVLVHDKIYIFGYNTSILINIHNGAMDYDYMPKLTQNIEYLSCASFYDGNKTYIAAVGGNAPIKTLIFDIVENVWSIGMKTNDNLLVFSEKRNFPKTYRA